MRAVVVSFLLLASPGAGAQDTIEATRRTVCAGGAGSDPGQRIESLAGCDAAIVVFDSGVPVGEACHR